MCIRDRCSFTGDVDIKASIREGLLTQSAVGICCDEVVFAVVVVGKVGNRDIRCGGADDDLIGSCGGCTSTDGC